jgi:hypothetical protein
MNIVFYLKGKSPRFKSHPSKNGFPLKIEPNTQCCINKGNDPFINPGS